jgi:hypothetical protein
MDSCGCTSEKIRCLKKKLVVKAFFRHLNLGTKTIHPVKYNILFSPNQA